MIRRTQFFKYLTPTYIRLYGRLFTDTATPGWPKAIVVAALAYVISPMDLVPDWLAGLGWLDDLAIMVFGLANLVRKTPPKVVAKHLSELTNDSLK